MKIKGKEITKKTVLFLLVGLFVIGVASAALVNYISNSVTASVDVSAVGLNLGIVSGFAVDPVSAIYDDGSSGPIALPGIMAGEDSGVTVMISNPTTSDLVADINIGLSYVTSLSLPADDPMNCDATGAYDPTGTLTCAICGPLNDELCMDGQELDVLGIRTWNNALSKWDPEPSVCTGLGMVAGDFDNNYYYDGSLCFWNFLDELMALGLAPANPMILIQQSNQNIPPGALYTQLVIKSKLDNVNGVQIAPGQYSLTANIQ